MIRLLLEVNPLAEDTLMVTGQEIDRPVILRGGDRCAVLHHDTGYVIEVGLRRPDQLPEPLSTIERIHAWLQDRGVTATRPELIELLRIWSGVDHPQPGEVLSD